jgi:D-erythrulose 4-kinase
MTHLYNDPVDFKMEVIEGFAAAYSRYVDRVPHASGFVRRGGPREGKVSVVVGGGLGHDPSYAGIVGAGFADGCVLGDIFTSPSAEQIYRVARAADGGAGIVFAFGNYAGDRLNFAAACKRLTSEGIDSRMVYVTDDIASASVKEADARRGIAGTHFVYKVGGAAADAGLDLDGVERVMQSANKATFSFGAAFAGCTFPGQVEPLFKVNFGEIEIGLGIHGEPGIENVPWMPAADLAAVLVRAILAERPNLTDGRAAVLVNGLGATKCGELLVLYKDVDRLIRAEGIEPILPEVGELVTSLNMAGCSLTIAWLDDELERYWTAPVDTAGFRRGDVTSTPTFAARSTQPEKQAKEHAVEGAASESVEQTEYVRQALDALADVITEHEDYLGHIDAVAGDGDHGVGMKRGATAARLAAHSSNGGVETVLRAAADAFSDRAGGTSGILWGVFLSAIGEQLGNHGPVTALRLAAAIEHGAGAIQAAGKANLGDKTMLDSLLPFAAALTAHLNNGAPLREAWTDAALTATTAAEATASLIPRVGRARPLAAKSVGTPDPGAISMALILAAVGSIRIAPNPHRSTSDE